MRSDNPDIKTINLGYWSDIICETCKGCKHLHLVAHDFVDNKAYYGCKFDLDRNVGDMKTCGDYIKKV